VRGRTAVLVDAMTPLGQRGGRGLIWGGAVMVNVESSRDICEQLTDFGVTTRLHPLPREGLKRRGNCDHRLPARKAENTAHRFAVQC
jgi:hypothetical protein